jgi:hypothetical protein
MSRRALALFAILGAALTPSISADTCATVPWAGMNGVPPLTEFPSAYLYLGTYAGLLYDGTNQMPPDHDADGLAFGANVQPRDPSGSVCTVVGPGCKIVFLSIGFSNNTIEFCGGQGIGGDPDDPAATACPLPIASPPYIQSDSFIAQTLGDARVNHTSVVLVDGAKGGKALVDWDPTFVGFVEYNRVRDQILVPSGLSPLQVQSVWVKDANGVPTVSLATGGPGNPPDAIVGQRHLGNIVRAIKAAYPNVQQVFISPRIYGGYANTAVPPNNLNPEPYAFELGFSIKWLVRSQIQQVRGAPPDEDAGSLDYKNGAAPWIGWGPYLWANGTTPRRDGTVWLNSDFRYRYSSGTGVNECTHPSINAERKVAGRLLDFMTATPQTDWFLATPLTCRIAGGSLRLAADRQSISWASNGSSGLFDVVKGDLGVLRASAGDFGAATCFENDLTALSTTDPALPAAGEAIYYLVRCNGGTWSDGTQRGNRETTLVACP